MDDRKNLFVIIFVTFFVMVYVQWMFPQQPQPQQTQTQVQQQQQQQAAPTVPGTNVQTQLPGAQSTVGNLPAPHTRPSAQQLKDSPQTVINTGVALFTVNHLGSRIQDIKLKGYKAKLDDDTPLEMISWRDGAQLPLGVYADGTNDDFVLYSLDAASLPPMDAAMYNVTNNPVTFVFNGDLATGTHIKKSLTFVPGSYAIQVDVELSAPARDGSPVTLEWSHVVPKDVLPKVGTDKRVFFLGENKKLATVHLKDIVAPAVAEGLGSWIALSDYYFLEGIISSSDHGYGQYGVENEAYVIRMSGDLNGGSFIAYAGPKDIETLKSVGHSLERSVDLGTFSFIAHPILALMKFFYRFLGNYGLSIILLTLLIKLLFLPLTQTSFKSMKAMQDLQPEIQALRERVQDQNVLNQELMALYKKRGVNPLGGCFPVLIQIPVFLGLYNALLNSVDLRHEPFALWIRDLSAPEHLDVFGIGVPLMILIMGASMVVQQWTQPSAMDPQQKKIMMFMPLIFTFMFIIHPMPSGLVLYWLVNNLISIVQQKYIRGHKGANPLTATAYASLAMFCFGYLLTLL